MHRLRTVDGFLCRTAISGPILSTTTWVVAPFALTGCVGDDRGMVRISGRAALDAWLDDRSGFERVLGGRAPRLPGLQIDGCFLQALSRLSTTDYGVLCVRTADARRTTLRNTDPQLWHAVQLVGANFAQIRTGNCVFSSADWLSFLTTNKFPPDERLRGPLPA